MPVRGESPTALQPNSLVVVFPEENNHRGKFSVGTLYLAVGANTYFELNTIRSFFFNSFFNCILNRKMNGFAVKFSPTHRLMFL